ncbi:uncharacterized protein SCDLUD_004790 [Saccharomycodes ludwigii]|uniref:uncharacterized protein n=1 Tax=Saccharomycodes ludwigii TaxID=36035 RepID=UPI001E86D0B5|nr:hypothetical protein SCDLUD_004790 [Saccharomycodes ludwigii]KAH3899350.1 hypothetical protein SCDLUD_004790 [Saccharomycodes ludwigii]
MFGIQNNKKLANVLLLLLLFSLDINAESQNKRSTVDTGSLEGSDSSNNDMDNNANSDSSNDIISSTTTSPIKSLSTTVLNSVVSTYTSPTKVLSSSILDSAIISTHTSSSNTFSKSGSKNTETISTQQQSFAVEPSTTVTTTNADGETTLEYLWYNPTTTSSKASASGSTSSGAILKESASSSATIEDSWGALGTTTLVNSAGETTTSTIWWAASTDAYYSSEATVPSVTVVLSDSKNVTKVLSLSTSVSSMVTTLSEDLIISTTNDKGKDAVTTVESTFKTTIVSKYTMSSYINNSTSSNSGNRLLKLDNGKNGNIDMLIIFFGVTIGSIALFM